jgi:hypothetical protein
MGSMLEFYLFLRFEPGHRVGHNPLAALSYVVVYLLILVELLTGLALYSRVVRNPILTQFIGWLPQLIDPQYLRTVHFFLMFVFFAFMIFQVCASVLVSLEIRGVAELAETVQDEYPRPIPVPVTSLRPIRANCEECHWPANFFGAKAVRLVHFLSDEQNTRWEIGLVVLVGGAAPVGASQMGIHWHVGSKVEYIASDPERQNVTWVRSVDPKTGVANVYTSDARKSTTAPPGEIRTMDCVDCHNRPSHILQSPDWSVDVALADGRIDPSLPFIKQQSVVALTATYADNQQALRGIDSALRGYYQKTYPQIYTGKQQAIAGAIACLQNTYSQNFFPAMKVRWDTYYMNEGHFHFPGCFRCHDGQHKSMDGKAIRSGCGDCHQILQQGKAGSLQFAKGPQGLDFEHPVDIGTAWAEQPCNSCHTGGPQ